jgi:class I fructose-bisphosphate aldolase/fructose-bisphosphate aldolase/2-amino-3,7-dideoxy-D-threo-hept-6-ulosonate synthase
MDKALRMRSILDADSRTVIIAMDHAIGLDVPALASPGDVISEVTSAGVDAILTTPGTVRRDAHRAGRAGLILSVDNHVDVAPYAVEQALRLGVDGIKVEAFPGAPDRPLTVSNLQHLAAECAAWGMPLVAEMIPVSFAAKHEHTAKNIRIAARVGSEAGADLVKIPHPGDDEEFAEIVANTPAPVVILGGPRGAGDLELLRLVHSTVKSGGAGVAFGRHCFEHKSPKGMARALVAVIHGGLDPEEALELAAGDGSSGDRR